MNFLLPPCRRVCLLVILLLPGYVSALSTARAGAPTTLSGDAWQIAPQADVPQSGEEISRPGFAAAGWIKGQVPGTVFGSYVLAGKEKDPNFADNIYHVDLTKYDRNFWYRTDFDVPETYRHSRVWLNLDGVNRDADVFLNGHVVGSMHGFFQRGCFDVTALVQVGARNSLAVLDYVPVLFHKETPKDRDSENFSSPSFVCAKGWDWMPRVPGLDMGIYKDVYLSATGDVSLHDPWVRTEKASAESADLSIATELRNHSPGDVSGQLEGEINPGKITFAQPVTIRAGASQTVTMTSQAVAALRLNNPKLWWPSGYGDPNLYTVRLSFRVGNAVSDQKDITFGVRKYSYDTNNQILHFHINGIPIFPKGGSWGMAEYLLRCKAKDYDTMVRLHREENFNIIRNWMGMTPDAAFYDACDRNGIMVWDEFWLNSSGGTPRDIPVFEENAVEKIKMFRNHACVCLWCGDNEGTPPAPLNAFLAEAVKTHDGDDRPYQPCSNRGNLSGSGPWHDFEPIAYFTGAGIGRAKGTPFGMRSELGTATFTTFDSFKKFMPPETRWPRNDMWNKHFFGRSANNGGPDGYFADVNKRYGQATGIEDFCRKSQLLNLETMKAMFEGFLDHSDKDSAGLIIWMSQSAYPSLVWQTFDYYYDLTGAYWGAKTACEPVHIYCNPDGDRIRVVNTSGKPAKGLTADAWIYNADGTQKSHQTATLDSSPDAVADCFALAPAADLSPTYFIKLQLSAPGRVVSQNFYWRATASQDYTSLSSLKAVQLEVKPQGSPRANTATGMSVMAADITNPANSGTVALAIRPMLIHPGSGEQVLPVYMNEGYFSLVPGETKHVTMEYQPAKAEAEVPRLQVECWNNYPR